MSRNHWCLIALTALAPISVQVQTHGDTTTVIASDGTRFEVMGGVGEYAFISRGCEGEVIGKRPVSFRDLGGAVEHGIPGTGFSVGVRGGWMHDDIAGVTESGVVPASGLGAEPLEVENRYVNPYFTYERPRGSVGLGWVLHDKEFITTGEGARKQNEHPLNDVSWHMRIGSEQHYVAARWMEGVPLYSSGGYFTLGVGGHPDNGPVPLFVGLGAGGPYEGAGLVIQTGYDFPAGVTANVRTRLGTSGSENASGVSIGLSYGTPRP